MKGPGGLVNWMGVAAVLGAALLSACAPPSVPTSVPTTVPPGEAPAPATAQEPSVTLQPWSFSALNGWAEDDHARALKAFQKSCEALLKRAPQKRVADNDAAPGGLAGDWHPPCRVAVGMDTNDPARAQAFFETWFQPFAVVDGGADDGEGATGLFTGYFVPQLNGALERGGPYQTPLLSRPKDLVSVNLGDFDDELGGNTVWGRVEGSRLVPYPDRRAIEAGALDGLAQPILWVDSSVDAFFLHVQGSGQVRLRDGTVRHIGFAGKNGRPYRSIGRLLIDRGEIPADRLTMASIRDWVEARPEAGRELLRQNPSYVFFRPLEREGAIGAQGVTLTDERSLAVDRRFMPLGAPLWVETHDPLDKAKPFNRLMVAQDTGGAIKGVVRGDIFFGAGDGAGRRAGNMKRPGRYFLLLPVQPR